MKLLAKKSQANESQAKETTVKYPAFRLSLTSQLKIDALGRCFSTYGHVEELAHEMLKGTSTVEGVEFKLWQRLVIVTKSVEFMPFFLSFFLTLNASIWLCYGVLSKDKFVALPNIPGLVLSIIQMVLYYVYKDAKPERSTILPTNQTVVPTLVVVGYQCNEAADVEGGGDRANMADVEEDGGDRTQI